MEYVIDTSIVIAVITNEPTKAQLVRLTEGASLSAPPSIHWEVGNAFAAMLKRNRLSIEIARQAIATYQEIPIRFIEVDIDEALQIAAELNLYAYDSYILSCARKRRAPLLTLDRGLRHAARQTSIIAPEVTS